MSGKPETHDETVQTQTVKAFNFLNTIKAGTMSAILYSIIAAGILIATAPIIAAAAPIAIITITAAALVVSAILIKAFYSMFKSIFTGRKIKPQPPVVEPIKTFKTQPRNENMIVDTTSTYHEQTNTRSLKEFVFNRLKEEIKAKKAKKAKKLKKKDLPFFLH